MLKFTKKHKLFSLFTPLEDRTPSNLSERSNETFVQKKKKKEKKKKKNEIPQERNHESILRVIKKKMSVYKEGDI